MPSSEPHLTASAKAPCSCFALLAAEARLSVPLDSHMRQSIGFTSLPFTGAAEPAGLPLRHFEINLRPSRSLLARRSFRNLHARRRSNPGLNRRIRRLRLNLAAEQKNSRQRQKTNQGEHPKKFASSASAAAARRASLLAFRFPARAAFCSLLVRAAALAILAPIAAGIPATAALRLALA